MLEVRVLCESTIAQCYQRYAHVYICPSLFCRSASNLPWPTLPVVFLHCHYMPSSVLHLPLHSAVLAAPSLSGQLTGCFRAFPSTGATGKSRGHGPVWSSLILHTWTVLSAETVVLSCSFLHSTCHSLASRHIGRCRSVHYYISISLSRSSGLLSLCSF